MTSGEKPPYTGVEWDDALETHPEAVKAITQGLLSVDVWLKQNAPNEILTLHHVESFHRWLFDKVFPEYAGRIRGPAPDYLPHWAEFGNFKAEDHTRVPDACAKLFATLKSTVEHLDALRLTLSGHDFDDEVIRAAAYVHCEFIRIHPFKNGNGRLARICINYFAWRYGATPMPVARPKEPYIDAIRTYLQQRISQHFADVLRPLWAREPGEDHLVDSQVSPG